jgi:hypothetical protein
MINLGLSSSDLVKFQQSLITGYNLKIVVQILDLNHRYITDVSALLVDGQVNHSFYDAVSYSSTLTLMDPDNVVGFDTFSPVDNALYADRMIKIIYSVFSDLLPRWVDVPIFCGQVTKLTRDDAILSVECQGKEAMWGEPAMGWYGRTYRKGTLLTSAIRDVMARYTGETRFDFPSWATKISRDMSVSTETVVWDFALALQGSRNVRHLFYDGRGVLRLRSAPTRPIFTFTESHLTSVPKLDYNHADVRNTAYIKGAQPEHKPQIRAWKYLPATNPSSSVSLGRNGVRRFLVEMVEDSAIITKAQAEAQAWETLNSLATTAVGYDFDSFPIPHLEPGDIFHLTTRDASFALRATEFSIPLKAGTSQSNGTTRKLSANKARLRRRR